MARAMLKPEGEQGKRTDLESQPLADLQEVSASQVSRARFVLRHDEALAQSVMSGAGKLSQDRDGSPGFGKIAEITLIQCGKSKTSPTQLRK